MKYLTILNDYLECKIATNYAITILNENECRSTFMLEYFSSFAQLCPQASRWSKGASGRYPATHKSYQTRRGNAPSGHCILMRPEADVRHGTRAPRSGALEVGTNDTLARIPVEEFMETVKDSIEMVERAQGRHCSRRRSVHAAGGKRRALHRDPKGAAGSSRLRKCAFGAQVRSHAIRASEADRSLVWR